MSCEACEVDYLTTYVRVGNGNVEIAGCKVHLAELLRRLNAGNRSLSSALPVSPSVERVTAPAPDDARQGASGAGGADIAATRNDIASGPAGGHEPPTITTE